MTAAIKDYRVKIREDIVYQPGITFIQIMMRTDTPDGSYNFARLYKMDFKNPRKDFIKKAGKALTKLMVDKYVEEDTEV